MNFGFSKLIIILAIVLLLFGPGRVAKIGGELGVAAIHEFRRGLTRGASKATDENKTPSQDTQ